MKRNLYILLTLFAVLLAGCEHKDFCCRCLQADDVEVVFDWSRSPDADPASMKVYFFPEGGGEALVYEFADIHGGSIRLPAGTTAPCVSTATRNSCITNTLTASTPSVPVPAEACHLPPRSLGLPVHRGDTQCLQPRLPRQYG